MFLSVSQLFGCGSVAQTVLSKGALGEPLTIHVGFTLGVMMAVYMAGGVSGKKKHTDTHTAHVRYNNKSSTFELSCLLLIILKVMLFIIIVIPLDTWSLKCPQNNFLVLLFIVQANTKTQRHSDTTEGIQSCFFTVRSQRSKETLKLTHNKASSLK